MTTYIDNRLITLNSKNATKNNGTYNSDVLFNFRGVLKEEHDIINTEIELINAQIPISFYMINATNNKLSYTLLGNTKTLLLTYGNYTSLQFINALKAGFLLISDSFGITISVSTGNIKFTNGSDFTFNYASSTIMTLLGFTTSASSTSGVLIAPYPLNIASITALNVVSDALATYNYSSNTNLTNSIMTLNIDKAPWGIITFQSQSKQSRLLRYKIINSIDIKIQDQNGNLINFNSIDWNITFSIQILRYLPLTPNLDLYDTLKTHNEKLLKPLGINESTKTAKDDTPQNTDEDLELLTKD